MSKPTAGGRKAAKNKKAPPETPDPTPEDKDADSALNAFMSEIESDLRDEKLQEYWDRYKNLLFAALAAMFIGVAGYQYLQSQQAEQLRTQADAYAAAAEALDSGNTDAAMQNLAAVAEQGGNYAALARLRRAALLLEDGQTAEALEIYKAMSDDTALDYAFTDLALLLWVLHGIDTEDPAMLKDALSPLTSPSNTYSYPALELLALLEAKQGNRTQALSILDGLIADANTPASIRTRAEELSAVYQSPVAAASQPSPSSETP